MTECYHVHLGYDVLDAWTLSSTGGACYGHPSVGKQVSNGPFLILIRPAQNCLQLHIQQCFGPNVTLSKKGSTISLCSYYRVSYIRLYDSISIRL